MHDEIGQRMKIGVFSRTGERTMDGQGVPFSDIKALAVTAEAAGLLVVSGYGVLRPMANRHERTARRDEA